MAETTEEVTELPAVDEQFEDVDHPDLTDDEATLGQVVYKEVDDLDDESTGLLHTPGKEN